MPANLRKVLLVVLIIILVSLGIWYFGFYRVNAQPNDLSASGTIEAVQVNIAQEIGGKVKSVWVDEGQFVSADQSLLSFDRDLLDAQLKQAQAALSQAQANYELVSVGLPPEQRDSMIKAAEMQRLLTQQALDNLIDTADLAAAQAYQAMVQAEAANLAASERLDTVDTDEYQQDLDDAWERVLDEKDVLEGAQDEFDRVRELSEDNPTRIRLENDLEDAQKRYDETLREYESLKNNLENVRAQAAQAKAVFEDAHRVYEDRKDGPDPQQLQLARVRLEAARAQLAAAQANPQEDQIVLAEAQVAQAQAALEMAQVRLNQADVTSPVDGVILSRMVEPGEVVAPGAVLLTLAQLNDLTITVYIPEDRYGTINLGESASVSVDSFPGEIFNASVIHIADRAEFTPRNVQTAEGRQTTVFAVKLKVDSTDGKLKPGMPADVLFDQ